MTAAYAADARNAFLFSDCCTLLAEIQIQKRNLASAQFWLRRAISIQTDIGPPSTLAATLRTLSKLLVERERYLEAREVLRGADTILLDCESDQGVQAVVRAAMQARSRLSAARAALVQEMLDRHPAAEACWQFPPPQVVRVAGLQTANQDRRQIC